MLCRPPSCRGRCTADCGWITGHSYLTYGPLLNGVTNVVFEGTPTHPTPARCWEVVAKYKARHQQEPTSRDCCPRMLSDGVALSEGDKRRQARPLQKSSPCIARQQSCPCSRLCVAKKEGQARHHITHPV